ncbi:MAG: polymerase 3-5 exonuclease subunit [Parcubacteria group bacterium]|nr:polymerase 3-5 exonuclease subunit [Parcubacteria group bacterium]
MILLDVETTGTDPLKHSLVSIAALDFDDPEERFFEECRIWEGAEIDEKALEINGLSPEELVSEERKTEADAVQNFIDWVNERRDTTIGGQNPLFDVSFIRSAAERAGKTSPLFHRTVDMHTLAWAHMQKRGLLPHVDEKKYSALGSDAIMKYVGLPPEPKPHVGLNSPIWECEAIHRLVFGKPKLEEFEKYPIPWL